MAFQEGTDEIICARCGAKHRVRWSRSPVREQTSIRCLACRDIAYSGNTIRDYFDVTLVQPDSD